MDELRLFIADDDRDDREMFIEGLAKFPYDHFISQFGNGVELMKSLKSDSPLPDAIFLDLYMPLLNGFDCLTDIRNIPEFSEIGIIIFSTINDQNVIDLLKSNGANQYIQKPASYTDLKTLLFKSLNYVLDTKTDPSIKNQFIILS
tara:strand:+ start:6902 stop:7339 length:438 start_codon:yes stop_codon:yes gene_type:complete